MGSRIDCERGDYSDIDRGDYTDQDRGDYTDQDRGDYTDQDRGDYSDVDRGDYSDIDRGHYESDLPSVAAARLARCFRNLIVTDLSQRKGASNSTAGPSWLVLKTKVNHTE
jgi:hypothetical protein